MELTVLGYSPAVENAGAACSSYLFSEGDSNLLVDAGHGSVGVLRSVLEISQLTAIIITHMHADHIFDLVPLAYGFKFGRLPRIPLFLPPDGYPVMKALQDAAGLGEGFFRDTYSLETYAPTGSLSIGSIQVDIAPTQHYIPAQALRFSAGEPRRPAVFSADTGWVESVVELMRGATLALVEATVPEYHSENEAYGHLTPQLAGRMAREAGVERLIVTHYGDLSADVTLREAERSFGGPVELAKTRARYTV